MTETQLKMQYQERPKIIPEDARFNQILVSAMRYALGRKSYVVGDTVNYIAPLLPYLQLLTLECMRKDIEEHAEMHDLGMDCDARLWMQLHSEIVREISQRYLTNG